MSRTPANEVPKENLVESPKDAIRITEIAGMTPEASLSALRTILGQKRENMNSFSAVLASNGRDRDVYENAMTSVDARASLLERVAA